MLAGLLFNTLEKQLLPGIALDPGRCLRSRLGSSPCAQCLVRCTTKALTIDDGKITLREDRCTECMTCISTCPNDALTSSFDLSALLRVLHESRDGEPITLSCGKSPCHSPNRVTVPCIGFFSEPLLAAMNVVAAREFYLDIHGCADCDNGHILGLLHARMLGVLGKNGSAAQLRMRYLTDPQAGPASPRQERRSFLGMIKNNLAGLGRASAPVARTADKGKTRDKSASSIPRLLQEALAMLPESDTAVGKLLLSYLYTLVANGNCDLCPRCTGMCPTGALKRLRNDAGEKQLSFTSAKCSGCGLCVAFCNKKALTLQQGSHDPPGTARVIA
jgi:ferredoxin